MRCPRNRTGSQGSPCATPCCPTLTAGSRSTRRVNGSERRQMRQPRRARMSQARSSGPGTWSRRLADPFCCSTAIWRQRGRTSGFSASPSERARRHPPRWSMPRPRLRPRRPSGSRQPMNMIWPSPGCSRPVTALTTSPPIWPAPIDVWGMISERGISHPDEATRAADRDPRRYGRRRRRRGGPLAGEPSGT